MHLIHCCFPELYINQQQEMVSDLVPSIPIMQIIFKDNLEVEICLWDKFLFLFKFVYQHFHMGENLQVYVKSLMRLDQISIHLNSDIKCLPHSRTQLKNTNDSEQWITTPRAGLLCANFQAV